MKYYSTKLNRLFDSEESLKEAEIAYDEKQKEAEKIKAERAEAAKKVEEAFKLADSAQKEAEALLQEFIDKYGSYHKTVREPLTSGASLYRLLNNFPFWF